MSVTRLIIELDNIGVETCPVCKHPPHIGYNGGDYICGCVHCDFDIEHDTSLYCAIWRWNKRARARRKSTIDVTTRSNNANN